MENDTVNNPIYCTHCGMVRFYSKKTGKGGKFCVGCGKPFIEDLMIQNETLSSRGGEKRGKYLSI